MTTNLCNLLSPSDSWPRPVEWEQMNQVLRSWRAHVLQSVHRVCERGMLLNHKFSLNLPSQPWKQELLNFVFNFFSFNDTYNLWSLAEKQRGNGEKNHPASKTTEINAILLSYRSYNWSKNKQASCLEFRGRALWHPIDLQGSPCSALDMWSWNNFWLVHDSVLAMEGIYNPSMQDGFEHM